MVDKKVYNFDEDVSEYFDFIVKGHSYRFKHMNTEELEKLQAFGTDTKKANEYLYQFVSSVDETSPDFKEISKQMIVPQWAKFREMITTEFGG